MFSQEQWGQLLANFIEEGRELIRQAESALLALDDGEQDPDLINGLFRAVHTLKGSAGLFSLDEFVYLFSSESFSMFEPFWHGVFQRYLKMFYAAMLNLQANEEIIINISNIKKYSEHKNLRYHLLTLYQLDDMARL